MNQILLIEPFPVYAVALRYLLLDAFSKSRIQVVEEISSEFQGSADLVFIDYFGPQSNEGEVIRAIQVRLPNTQIVMMVGRTLPVGSVMGGALMISRNLRYAEMLKILKNLNPSRSPPATRSNNNQTNIKFDGSDKPLTIKQVEVMELCVQGLTAKEIGRELSLSPETVRAHIKLAYMRLKATTRSEAIHNYLQAKARYERNC